MERTESTVVQGRGLSANFCGYCKSNACSSVAYWLRAHSLSVHDYQDLLDRGWRRCGMSLYRPEMEKSCCPSYTIRLKVNSFHKSKDQIRVMHRMERYLDGTYNGPPKGEVDKENKHIPESILHLESQSCDFLMLNETGGTNDTNMDCIETYGANFQPQEKRKLVKTDDIVRDISLTIEAAIESFILSCEGIADIEIPKVNVQRVQPSLRRRIKNLNGEPSYTCNIAFQYAAALSKHNNGRNNQMSDRGHEIQDKSIKVANPVVLAELIALKLQDHNGLHNLKVEACKGHLNFLSMSCAAFDSKEATKCGPSCPMGAEIDSGGQGIVVAKDLTSRSTVNSCHVASSTSGHAKRKRRLETRLRRSAFDPEEFALYKKYQVAVHHDWPEAVQESSYRRFLVDSPLIFVPSPEEGTSFCGFGSFHQQYWIDGCLVAVGVVDILPSCLSSKYLFWDPDLAFLSLGKYSALQEIQWIQQAQKYCQSLEYYYLGYYIHSCPKMRYKAAYRPSELLCPVRFLWVPIDIAHPLLDENPYVCLSNYLDAHTMQRSTKDLFHIKRKSCNFIDENESNDEPQDRDHGEVQNQILSAAAQNVEIASSSKESEDISNVLLKLGNRYLQFKDLQAWMDVPQVQMDTLVCKLRKYSQVVGLNLAARMAYALV